MLWLYTKTNNYIDFSVNMNNFSVLLGCLMHWTYHSVQDRAFWLNNKTKLYFFYLEEKRNEYFSAYFVNKCLNCDELEEMSTNDRNYQRWNWNMFRNYDKKLFKWLISQNYMLIFLFILNNQINNRNFFGQFFTLRKSFIIVSWICKKHNEILCSWISAWPT